MECEAIVLLRLVNDEVEELYLRDHRDERKPRTEPREVGQDGGAGLPVLQGHAAQLRVIVGEQRLCESKVVGSEQEYP